jgi:uncharacterized caspase-like protein
MRHVSMPSASNDAREAAKKFRKIGFEVVEVHEVANSAEFWNTHVKPFVSKISENDFAVFYFSGNGMSYAGENYLTLLEDRKIYPKVKCLMCWYQSHRSRIFSREETLVSQYSFSMHAVRSVVLSREQMVTPMPFQKALPQSVRAQRV